MMKPVFFSSSLLLCLTVCLPAQETVLPVQGELIDAGLINDVDQATIALHPATPFLESSSLLLADMDLEKINVAAALKWLEEIDPSSDWTTSAETIRGFIDSLKGAGVSHAYLSAATRSPVDGSPVVIVPCENPAVINALATVLIQRAPDRSALKIHAGENVVVVGAGSAIDRVTAREGASRPDLILPLGNKELLDHTLVLSLPAEARRELEAFWPEQLAFAPLPQAISPRQLAKDVSRIVISLRLPPEPEMMVRIETINASAANRVRQVIDDALSLAGDARSSIQLDVEIADVKLQATPQAFVKIASTILAPARVRSSYRRKMNSIKQIGLALHNYHAHEKHFPAQAMTDAEGRRLLSWRVAILPYLEQQAMFRAMKIDQPWDSEDNRQATSTLIPVYCDDAKLGNKTTLRAPVFPGSLWDANGVSKSIRDVRDGTSKTIVVIDAPANAAIEWANPQPWVLSETDPMSDVFGDRDLVTVGMADGSAHVFNREEMTNEKLKALLTIAGGEVVD